MNEDNKKKNAFICQKFCTFWFFLQMRWNVKGVNKILVGKVIVPYISIKKKFKENELQKQSIDFNYYKSKSANEIVLQKKDD